MLQAVANVFGATVPAIACQLQWHVTPVPLHILRLTAAALVPLIVLNVLKTLYASGAWTYLHAKLPIMIALILPRMQPSALKM